jgi:hypothetical protein
VDREEQHPQFGVAVHMSKRLDAIADAYSSSRTSP